MRELAWMLDGREESEWFRLSAFMAFIANRLRFNRNDPVTHPRDLNPYYRLSQPQRQPKDIKDKMNDFFARNPQMPIRTMKCVDGQWIEVTNGG